MEKGDSRNMQIYATTVAIGDVAVALTGPSGAGKSDLALRLIDGGALLVADDRTDLERVGDEIFASPPPALQGLLEIRGYGPVAVPWTARARLRLAVMLGASPPDRTPEPQSRCLLGVAVPLLRLNAFEASASAKIRLAAGNLPSPTTPSASGGQGVS